jgi:hypothetical protein
MSLRYGSMAMMKHILKYSSIQRDILLSEMEVAA